VRSNPTPTRPTAHAVSSVLVVLTAVFVALFLSSPATAATPCGKKVLGDWFDNGRIDRIYPLHCYEDAIDAIPDDLRDYANAEEVITRALQGALRGKLVPGGDDPTPDEPGGGTRDPGGPADPGDPTAAPSVDGSGPSSVPIPLLVLGGLSLALLAAGGLGYLSRRRQGAGDGDDELSP
jgi:hypothetical protein